MRFFRWLRGARHVVLPVPPPTIRVSAHVRGREQIRLEARTTYSISWLAIKTGDHEIVTIFMDPSELRIFANKHGIVVQSALS